MRWKETRGILLACFVGAGMRRESPSIFRSRRRIGPVVRFVMVAWGVATAFQVFEQGLPAVFALAIRRDYLSGDLTRGATAYPSACRGEGVAPRRELQALQDAAHARREAWDLGLLFGAEVARRDTASDTTAPTFDELEAIAQRLGVPRPRPDPPGSSVRAFTAFKASIGSDPHCVANELRRLYSPGHGALYQFAAVFAYARPYLVADPTTAGPAFLLDLRQYGAAAELPEAAWSGLVDLRQTSPAARTALLKTMERRLAEFVQEGR
jgi:hypothetical protein